MSFQRLATCGVVLIALVAMFGCGPASRCADAPITKPAWAFKEVDAPTAVSPASSSPADADNSVPPADLDARKGKASATGALVDRILTDEDDPDSWTDAQPTLRLDKPRYVVGEPTWFWPGVTSPTRARIPRKYWDSCRLHVTAPDGKTESVNVGWPCDGWVELGFTYKMVLPHEVVAPGVYEIAFEFAGRRTPPIRMSIDRLNIVDDLSAAFRFPRTGSIGAGERIPAVLTVRNDSAHTIRFRKRGYSSTGVSMRVISPRRHDGRFYPAEKLLGRSPVGLPSLSDIDFVDDRDAGRRAATIVLPPGEVFTRELPLEEAYDFKAGTQYEVTLWSMFSFYVAEKDGPYAEHNPIRVEATGTGRFEIVP